MTTTQTQTADDSRSEHMPEPTATPRRRRRLVAGGGLVAAAVAATLLLAAGGGSGGGGIGPAAALAEAAEQTAQVTSGVAKAVIMAPGAEPVETIVRFDGDAVEVELDEVAANGESRHRVLRSVGGQGYEQAEDGSWSTVEGGSGDVVARVRADIADKALFDAVRAADGVVQDGDTFRAHLAAEQAATIQNALLGLGGTPLADGADVEVVAGDDGLIRRVSVTSGDVARIVTYAELGEPQGLEAPEIAP